MPSSRYWSAIVIFAAFLSSCGIFSSPGVPDATTVQFEHLGVELDVPKTWSAQHEPEVKRSLIFVEKKNDRNNMVLIQQLSDHKNWREHVDSFRDRQEHALDKIESEAEHKILDGGIVFTLRQERNGRPPLRKLRYYIDSANKTYILDMAAPASAFNANLYQLVAQSIRHSSES